MSNDTKIESLILKHLQDGLDMITSGNSIGIEKIYQYTGQIILCKQILGRMGKKINVRVNILDEGV